MGNGRVLGQLPDLVGVPFGLERDIHNPGAAFTEEMGVFLQIGTVTRRFPLMADHLDQAAGGEGFQTIIDGGQRDGWHLRLDPHEDLDSGRMIPLVHQHVVNLPPLLGHPQAEPVDMILRGSWGNWEARFHWWIGNMPEPLTLSRPILNKGEEKETRQRCPVAWGRERGGTPLPRPPLSKLRLPTSDLRHSVDLPGIEPGSQEIYLERLHA